MTVSRSQKLASCQTQRLPAVLELTVKRTDELWTIEYQVNIIFFITQFDHITQLEHITQLYCMINMLILLL